LIRMEFGLLTSTRTRAARLGTGVRCEGLCVCHAQQRAVRQKAGRDSADMSVGVGFDILPWTSKVALVFALAFRERRWPGLEAANFRLAVTVPATPWKAPPKCWVWPRQSV